MWASKAAVDRVRRIAESLEGSGFHVIEVRPMVAMLGRVARKRGMPGGDVDTWVAATQAALDDVGVQSMRRFVTNAVRLNRMLRERGHPGLEEAIIIQVLEEITDMVMGPEFPEEIETVLRPADVGGTGEAMR